MLKKHKKLTKGRITIPKDLRAAFGLLPGQAVDLEETDRGILIRKHMPSCFVCGSIERVKAFKGFELCGECRKGLIDLD
ncbi:MAG: SpoVT / AbrB like domain protein [Firmicutes bacterium ADurb.Bin193]|nr:MAG: SpoVT / AbrB like domain protein [Firmicutes bacterium ADurb.Bin193]